MVTRRGFTTTIGAIGSVGAAYWAVTDAPDVGVDVDIDGAINESKVAAGDVLSNKPDDIWDQSLDSGIVSRIQFDEDGSMHVTFTDSHGLDAFGVWHVSDTWHERDAVLGYNTGFMYEQMPRYGGIITVNIAEAIRQVRAEFPSNRFKLVGLTGGPVTWESEGRVKFYVPKPLMP